MIEVEAGTCCSCKARIESSKGNSIDGKAGLPTPVHDHHGVGTTAVETAKILYFLKRKTTPVEVIAECKKTQLHCIAVNVGDASHLVTVLVAGACIGFTKPSLLYAFFQCKVDDLSNICKVSVCIPGR